MAAMAAIWTRGPSLTSPIPAGRIAAVILPGPFRWPLGTRSRGRCPCRAAMPGTYHTPLARSRLPGKQGRATPCFLGSSGRAQDVERESQSAASGTATRTERKEVTSPIGSAMSRLWEKILLRNCCTYDKKRLAVIKT